MSVENNSNELKEYINALIPREIVIRNNLSAFWHLNSEKISQSIKTLTQEAVEDSNPEAFAIFEEIINKLIGESKTYLFRFNRLAYLMIKAALNNRSELIDLLLHYQNNQINDDDNLFTLCLQFISQIYPDYEVSWFSDRKYDNFTCKNDGKIHIDTSEAEKMNLLMELLRQDPLLLEQRECLQFQFEPPKSSGEMSILTLFARLLDFFEKHPKNDPKTDDYFSLNNGAIFFLDEIEITVEPSFQRKMVKLIVDFINDFFKDNPCHIIFASHSPILLSDIPDSNVVFLEKDKDTGCTHVVDHGKTDKTFGANIYSLYKNSFFMKEGLMGEFAMDKIKKVFSKFDQAIELSDELDVLNKARDRKKNAKRIEEIKQELENIKKEETEIMSIISMVGEPLIQEQLLRYARGVFTKETREKDLREYYIDQLKKLGTEVIIK